MQQIACNHAISIASDRSTSCTRVETLQGSPPFVQAGAAPWHCHLTLRQSESPSIEFVSYCVFNHSNRNGVILLECCSEHMKAIGSKYTDDRCLHLRHDEISYSSCIIMLQWITIWSAVVIQMTILKCCNIHYQVLVRLSQLRLSCSCSAARAKICKHKARPLCCGAAGLVFLQRWTKWHKYNIVINFVFAW